MPEIEQVLVLIKPDGVERGLVGEVLSRIESRGFRIARLEMRRATPLVLARHYAEHVDRPFYPALVDYMTSGPLVAVSVEGTQAVAAIRALAGATDPVKAAPGTIRGDLGRDWGTGEIMNIVHVSDSPESGEREVALWFPDALQ
jgi:nucleoside-diphosphate kinase